jgi:uncharacterized repeat protein (TIGR03803 family)
VIALTIVTSGVARAQNFQVIHTFVGPDGAQPNAGLTFDRGGKLYGTVRTGHSGSNWGGAYQMRLHNGSWIFNTLYIFDGTLENRVVFGPQGLLYGASPNNLTGFPYGYLFSIRPAINACTTALCTWNFTWIYGFTGSADGGTVRYGDLIFDQAGNMYGTASLGGDSHSDGVVFKAVGSGSNWTESAIYTFAGSPDGSHPFAGVVFDSTGALWGTTSAGGSSGNGTIYKLTPSGSSWTEQVIYNFSGAADGGYPVGGLVPDGMGNFYGTTASGGSNGGGTVYELTPNGSSWNLTTLYSFTGTAQCGPWGYVSFDTSGNIYGTTQCDGANNLGSVFKLTPSGGGWTYSSLHDFTGGDDGRLPIGSVLLDSSNNVYGTASVGGQHNAGTVWEITP